MLRKWLAERKWQLLIEAILVLVVLGSHFYVATTPPNSLMNWFNSDDAFFYFRVAQNVVQGNGISFDGINSTNGFHPLWMAVLLPVFAVVGTERILALRVIVGMLAVLNAATGVILFRLLKKYVSVITAGIIALIWVCYPPVHVITTTRGMESGLSAFLLVSLLLAASNWLESGAEKKQPLLRLFGVGILGGLVLLSRLDNAFMVGFIGLWLVLVTFPLPRLMILDLGLAGAAVLGSAILRLGPAANFYPFLGWIFAMLVAALLLKPLTFAMLGLYEPLRKYSVIGLILRVSAAALISSAVLTGLMLGLHSAGVFLWSSRSMLLFDFGLTLVLLAVSRIIVHRFSTEENQPDLGKRILNWIAANWKQALTRGFAYFLPVGGMLGAYLLWSYTRFGTLSPVSGQIKHWWATMDNTVYGHPVDGLALLGFSSSGNYGPWSIVFGRISDLTELLLGWMGWQGEQTPYAFSFAVILILAALVGGLLIWRRMIAGKVLHETGMLAVLAGCLVQISFYLGTGYPNTRSWYWVGELLVVALVAAALTEALYLGARRWKVTRLISHIGLAGAVIFILFSYGGYILHITPPETPAGRENAYLGDVDGLLLHTEPGSLIGVPGGGMVSYFLEDRTVINLDGLMNSLEYFRAMQTGTASEFLDDLGLDYVFGNEYMVTSSDPYAAILENRLVKIGFIHGPEGFTLFRYVPPER